MLLTEIVTISPLAADVLSTVIVASKLSVTVIFEITLYVTVISTSLVGTTKLYVPSLFLLHSTSLANTLSITFPSSKLLTVNVIFSPA